MIELRQSTAVNVMLGVFVDNADGKTTEEFLTLLRSDLQLSKNGAAAAQKNDNTSATHRYGGNYSVPLNTTDTGTLGYLELMCKESGALPVKKSFMVVTQNYWDSKYSTDKLQVDVTQIGGVAQSLTDLKDLVDTGYDPTTHKVQGVVLSDTVTTYTGNTKQTADNNTILAHADHGNAQLVRATTPANKLDVSDTGEVGLDFANIKNATGAHTLTNITVPVCTTNSDMKGTDGANTVVPDVAGTAATPAEVATALTNIHLDHLFAADYDPASKPGAATALLNELIENDGGVSRYTENALENAPSGTGASAATIADAVWEELQEDHIGAGTFGITASEIAAIPTTAMRGTDNAATEAKQDIIDTNVDQIEVAVITNAAGTDIAADIIAIKAETVLIVEDTNELQLDLTNDGRLDLLLDRILAGVEIRQSSVNDASASTTKFITNLTETDNDFWNRMGLLFTSGNNSGQMRRIKDYVGASKEITMQTPLNAVPANADTFIIISERAFITPDIDDIADQICDELLADHTTAGSLAKKISDQVNPPSQTLNDYKATGFSTHNAAAVKTAIEAAGSHLALILAATGTDGVLLTAAAVDAILDEVIEGSLTMRHVLRLFLSALGGKSTGGGTATLTFRDNSDTKARITATVDASGNRTEMTLDGS